MGQVILNRLSEPFSITYQTVEATIESTNWEASGINGIVQNDVIFGGVTTSQELEDYAVSFAVDVTGNEFSNLPPQIITFSSASTTGPITLTKEVGQGAFTEKFVGSFVQVFQTSGPAMFYLITERVDDDTLTVYYQPGPSQGGTLDSLTKQLGGAGSMARFLFAIVNGTSDPNIQTLRAGIFEEQTQRVYSSPGFPKGASINAYFDIPANATSINGLAEFPNIQNVFQNLGLRYYALIFDNQDAYVANANGVRKIAKIENGNTFLNTNETYGEETWSQAGGDLQFITPYAMELNATNRVTAAQWAQAQVFPDISGYQEVTLAIALDTESEFQDAFTRGVQVTYNIEVADTTSGFGTDDFFVLELNMDETTIGDAADIETAWANIKYYEVLGSNEIRFFAPADSVTDVPIIAKVIK